MSNSINYQYEHVQGLHIEHVMSQSYSYLPAHGLGTFLHRSLVPLVLVVVVAAVVAAAVVVASVQDVHLAVSPRSAAVVSSPCSSSSQCFCANVLAGGLCGRQWHFYMITQLFMYVNKINKSVENVKCSL